MRGINFIIGENIRKRRLAQGLTLSKMAVILGMSYQQLQKYEKGSNRLSAETLVKLARHFGCSSDEICDLTPQVVDSLAQDLVQKFGCIKSDNLKIAIVDLVTALGVNTFTQRLQGPYQGD